jgi:hypothetical protein
VEFRWIVKMAIAERTKEATRNSSYNWLIEY